MNYYDHPMARRVHEGEYYQLEPEKGVAKRKHSITNEKEAKCNCNSHPGSMMKIFHGSFDPASYSEEQRSESPEYKHQRTQYQLIDLEPVTIRSPSPQYDPVLIAKTETYMVFEDEHHTYLHEVIPDEDSLNQLQQSSGFNAQPQHQRHESFGHFGRLGSMDLPDATIPDFSRNLEQFRLTDFGHFGEVDLVDLPNAPISAAVFEQFGLKDLPGQLNSHIHGSFYEFEKFGVNDLPERADTPLYQANGTPPAIESPKAVRFSPETVENRLLIHYCKNCGAKCCDPNGKYDCRILYKGEECQKCHHQGCLDFNERLAQKGVHGEERGSDGLICGRYV